MKARKCNKLIWMKIINLMKKQMMKKMLVSNKKMNNLFKEMKIYSTCQTQN